MSSFHIPVLLKESIKALNINPNGIYVDCTAGGGGHSNLILNELKDGRLIMIDRDPDAISVLNSRFSKDGKATIVNDRFSNISAILKHLNIESVDGILADLGVSSFQLDTKDRGFSFHNDAPLDMRMSKKGISAFDVVNTYPQDKLKEIITLYGEERFALNIAKNIVQKREKEPIETTFELVDVIKSSMPKAAQREAHPARRTFQAIRIEVNGELDEIKNALPDMFNSLNKGGHMAIITFHSLEDRIAKEYFRTLKKGCTCPREFPVCVCGGKPKAIVKGKAITPSQGEVEKNLRSRSAKLRTAVKL